MMEAQREAPSLASLHQLRGTVLAQRPGQTTTLSLLQLYQGPVPIPIKARRLALTDEGTN